MNPKRISTSIITIYDPIPNYGNRLQNYAVQETLRKLGAEATTLSFEASILSPKNRLKHILRLMRGSYGRGDKEDWKEYRLKVSAFEQFNREYIKTKNIKRIGDIQDADYFVVGSDQVWNPTWYSSHPLKKDLFLLTFTEPAKKVCFSPSFGIGELPEEWKPWFRQHLAAFSSLSVRERAGAKIIKELTGKTAEVLIDPTLMLEPEEWRNISKRPCRNVDTDTPYVLTYFLGDLSRQARMDLDRILAGKKKRVLSLMDRGKPELYVLGPGQFIYLLDHADLVLTDSFHGCVFSFLFGKPFLVYPREGLGIDMMSRIDTFLDTFDLKRKYKNSSIENEMDECSYEAGHRILEMERQKVICFLKGSMDMQ